MLRSRVLQADVGCPGSVMLLLPTWVLGSPLRSEWLDGLTVWRRQRYCPRPGGHVLTAISAIWITFRRKNINPVYLVRYSEGFYRLSLTPVVQL